MTAADALRAAREAGCVVSIDGGDLDLVGPDDVMAGIAAVLKPIKADILDMLRADPSHGIAYHLITDIAEARQALASMQGQWCALDLETFCPTPELVALPRKKCWSDTLFEARKREAAPLDPLIAEARLLQVAVVDSPVVIIDVPAVGRLSGLKTEIEALTAVGFNSVFEMAFLRAAGINVVLDDVKLADHVMGFAYDPQRGLREVARKAAAPRTVLTFETVSRPVDLEESIRDGIVDIAIDWLPVEVDPFVNQKLFDDRLVLLVRTNHPSVLRK